jgi:predicted nucleic acid-binding protein
MGVVIDTNVWADVERGKLTAEAVAAATGDEPVYLTPTVLAELWYGVHRAKSEAQRTKRLAAMTRIRRKPCLGIDGATGEIVGRIAADLDSRGRPATHRLNDLWIAAIAIQHGFAVLTRNPDDFGDIPGLRVIKV